MSKIKIILTAGLLCGSLAFAQKIPTRTSGQQGSKAPIPATNSGAGNPAARPMPAGPKPYRQVITEKAKTDNGLFQVHFVEDRYYFEIPDSLLSRDILVVSRISKAAAGVRVGMSGYAGDQIGENVVRFEKGPANKIFLRSISFSERSTDTTGMYSSVLNSSMQPIVASFDVRAYHLDSLTRTNSSVIDVQDYMNTDNDIFFFDASYKKALSLANILPDRSFLSSIRSFPGNIEVKAIKTYMKTAAPSPMSGSGGSSSPVTYELNSSLVLLPKKAMQPRYFDSRVGYFATGYVDYDANPQGVRRISMITRWKLEPKPEDVQKYLKGELVEPKKQIVFYIDPATPKKWVPYLIQGVNDWQVAFEKAGFKNAILAKEAPKDSSWSIDDASHNAIVYKPSEVPNASGPHVHDPRSGEIIETHVNWYHNVMNLVRNWYMVQTAAIDPRARKLTFDDYLMGQLIRFVSSHEIGHTLGLRHNYGSSSTVPVELLRNKKWVEEHGHTPSIMDYARFNYVAQPEDNINEAGIFPRIGDYDKWAIEWGYRWLPDFKSAREEEGYLNKWIIERTGENKRLWFGTETDASDPRSQNEDLGDNAMIAGTYGIKNLKRILPNVISWTSEPNGDYGNAKTIYSEIAGQFARYMGHAAKNIGGTYSTPKSVEQPGAQFSEVPFAKQKEAMIFLNRELFNTPKWLVDINLIKKAGVDPVSTIRNIQSTTLNRLLSSFTLLKLINNEATATIKTYTATDLMTDLKLGIWGGAGKINASDVYRRNLQKVFVEDMALLLKAPAPQAGMQAGSMMRQIDPTTSDISSIARGQLMQLRTQIKASIPVTTGVTRNHLEDLSSKIKAILDDRS